MIHTREEKIFQLTAQIIMAVFSVVIIVPFILMVVASFTSNDMLIRNGYSFLPEQWSLENYTYVFVTNGAKIMRSYGISFAVTAIGTVIGTVITVALGYAISRPGLPGRKLLSFLVFFTMLFNGGLIPTYMMYTGTFNIKNSFLALLIPSLLLNAFNVMLVKSYFITGVPNEILEAANIDGASEFKTFYKIAVPMARPIIATIALFVGLAYWNDWYNGYIYISTSTELYSIQNLLNRIQQNIQFLMQNSTNATTNAASSIPSEGVRMSMAMLGVLPIIIIYPFLQKNFVKGITLGGVKG